MRQSVIENSIGYRPVCAAGGLKIGRVVEMSSFGGFFAPKDLMVSLSNHEVGRVEA